MFQTIQSLATVARIKAAGGGGGADANTLLLLHMDGTDGAEVFTDSSSQELTVTNTGNTTTSSAQKKFGDTSMLCGSGKNLDITDSSLALGTSSDLTIDFWAYPTQVTAFSNLLFSFYGIAIRMYGLQSYIRLEDPVNVTTGANDITANVWQHIAWVRESGVTNLYVDGISEANRSSSVGDIPNRIWVGRTSTGEYFNGYIDEFRISDIARWSEGFTPPTEAY